MLSWPTDVDLVVVHFDLKPRGQECVEADDEVGMPSEEIGYPADDPWCVNTGGRERGREEGGTERK